jgi:hypothetical protein
MPIDLKPGGIPPSVYPETVPEDPPRTDQIKPQFPPNSSGEDDDEARY